MNYNNSFGSNLANMSTISNQKSLTNIKEEENKEKNELQLIENKSSSNIISNIVGLSQGNQISKNHSNHLKIEGVNVNQNQLNTLKQEIKHSGGLNFINNNLIDLAQLKNEDYDTIDLLEDSVNNENENEEIEEDVEGEIDDEGEGNEEEVKIVKISNGRNFK